MTGDESSSWNSPFLLHTLTASDKAYDDNIRDTVISRTNPGYSHRVHVTAVIHQVRGLLPYYRSMGLESYRSSLQGFHMTIPAIYVDDINVIRTPEEFVKAINCLKKEVDTKDLKRIKYCLVLQVEHLKNGILVHQEAYIAKVPKRFYMGKSHPLSIAMVVRSLDVKVMKSYLVLKYHNIV
ncbi:UNVERIFIED_CONTAM: hypothetical protein Slati_3485900 [Sesamum latifolium]|uniref:Reverse transcriptase Ty1/copia-type domain-containing protein n=1 Tax=Sesamum latifolium TaxID=2727402 RepID=A0AAW2UI32_9LAMI